MNSKAFGREGEHGQSCDGVLQIEDIPPDKRTIFIEDVLKQKEVSKTMHRLLPRKC
jgi:hypothetical protein